VEEKFVVQPVGVRYRCDSCKSGEMLPTGSNDWSSNLPNFEHKCNKCGAKVILNEKYPLIRYEIIIG